MRIRSREGQTSFSPADVMVQFTMSYPYLNKFSFVSLLSTFIDSDLPPPMSRKIYTWSQWGPANAYFRRSHPILGGSMVRVSGYHAILPNGDGIDFNPYIVAKYSAGRLDDLPNGGKVDTGTHRVTQRTIFAETVHTSLSCVVYPAPSNKLYQMGPDDGWPELYVHDRDSIKVRFR